MHWYGNTQCANNLSTYPKDGKTCGSRHNITHLPQVQKKCRKATYVRSVCDIRPQKTDTHRTRLTTRGYAIDYPVYVNTPTLYLTTMKLHVNRSISDIKANYMCMDMKYFYLKNMMNGAEYITIQIAMIPQEFVEKCNRGNVWTLPSRTNSI